jgi:DNA primase
VVVEGYTDVLAAHQAGIEQAVGVMGTAITPEQLQQLSPHTDRIVLAMDADRAGQDAMLRVIELARQKSIRLQIAPMPDGKDPADLLTGDRADQFRALLDDAVDASTFQVRTLLDRFDLASPLARDRALDEVARVLGVLDADSVEGQELLRDVANRLQADPTVVAQRVHKSKASSVAVSGQAPAATSMPRQDEQPAPPPPLSARERRERALLSMCIGSPVEGREFLQRLTPEHLSSPVVGRARDWLLGHLEDPVAGLPREDDELVSLVTKLTMQSEREPVARDAMELNFLQLEQAVLEGRIDAAQQKGGDPPVELHRRRAELAERIAHWETAGA